MHTSTWMMTSHFAATRVAPRVATRVALTVAFAVLFAACASAPVRGTPEVQSAAGSSLTPAELARRDSGRPPYTRADVAFMTGMIGHHAQAVTMARWAPTHGASASLQILAERIAIAQEDEIAFMRTWLADRGETPPEDHSHLHMPGMLSPADFAQLDSARGREFDRLFLTYMIRHHEGALTMVEQLLASPGAAQDDEVYRFVADVNVDQDTEIARMQMMLDAMRASP